MTRNRVGLLPCVTSDIEELPNAALIRTDRSSLSQLVIEDPGSRFYEPTLFAHLKGDLILI